MTELVLRASFVMLTNSFATTFPTTRTYFIMLTATYFTIKNDILIFSLNKKIKRNNSAHVVHHTLLAQHRMRLKYARPHETRCNWQYDHSCPKDSSLNIV